MRGRMTRGLLAGVLGLVLVAAPIVYISLDRVMLRQFDAALAGRAWAVASLLKRTSRGTVKLDVENRAMPEFGAGRHHDYFEVITGDGVAVAKAPSLGDGLLARRPGLSSPAFYDTPLPQGRRGRAVQMSVSPGTDEDEDEADAPLPVGATSAGTDPVIVVVAADRSQVDEVLRGLLVGLVVSAALVSGLAVLLVMQTVRGGLAPLGRLAEQAAAADVTSLTYRFSEEDMPAELVPICRRLNDLLDRLGAARERERRFTADVAHELRTPIAELRSLSEVALKWPPSGAGASQSFEDALHVARRMEATVTTLLELARCDAGRQAVAHADVDLSDVVRAVWQTWEPVARARGLTMDLSLPPHAPISSDPTLLASIVANVLSNAVEHGSHAGRLSCHLVRDGDALEWTVTNSTDLLEAADVSHLFEPFWRKDASRSESGHSGLGLTLVASYARLVGAEILAELCAEGLRFRARFTAGPEA